MFDRKVLKQRAKYVLSRSFLMSIVACGIVSLVSGGLMTYNVQNVGNVNFSGMSNIRVAATFAVAGIAVLLAVAFSIFVTAPLKVGLRRFMLSAADGDTNLENLLFPFKNNYKNIVWVTFVKNLYIGLWSMLVLIPILVGSWGYFDEINEMISAVQNDSVTAAMALMLTTSALSLVMIVFLVPAIIKELQYSMVEYILAENPDSKVRETIGKSKELMVGNKWAYVKLMLSFVGWQLVAGFVCCVGGLILAPYMEATYTQMYLEISGQGKDYPGYDYQNPFSQNPFDNFRNM